jgi:hypothetical protein
VPLKEIIAGDPGALLLMTMLPVALPVAEGANCAEKGTLDPGLMESGRLSPARRNPVPAAVAWEMVSAAFPEFVREIFWLAVPPTFTFPKLTLVGAIVNLGWVPVPLRATTTGEADALLVIAMLPLLAPGDAGENIALKEAVCPPASVMGEDKPLMLKPAPEATALEIVTLALPEFVRVAIDDWLLPTRMFPKLMLSGLAERVPCSPVPLSAISVGELEALLTSETLPEAIPAAVAPNFTTRLPDCPGASVSGKLNPLMLNPGPTTRPSETLRLAVPEFVTVTA